MKVGIAGCGWLGEKLAHQLVEEGHVVIGTTTSEQKIIDDGGFRRIQMVLGHNDFEIPQEFYDCDAFVIAFPPSAGKKKSKDYEGLVIQLLQQLPSAVRSLVLISSTGVYRGISGEVDEESEVKNVKNVLFEAEEACINQYPDQARILRCGGLFGANRIPGKYFSDKEIDDDGSNKVNYIHYKDVVKMAIRCLNEEVPHGRYNVCCPKHPTRFEVYKIAAEKTGIVPARFNPNKPASQGHLVKANKYIQVMNGSLIYESPLDFDYD